MTEHRASSVDRACYDEVMNGGVPVVTRHDLTTSEIIATPCRLPEDVRWWALKKYWFTSVGIDTHARAVPAETTSRLSDRGLVILRDVTATELGGEAQSTIAHEIGHLLLGHRLTADASEAEVELQEGEAYALAREWASPGVVRGWSDDHPTQPAPN